MHIFPQGIPHYTGDIPLPRLSLIKVSSVQGSAQKFDQILVRRSMGDGGGGWVITLHNMYNCAHVQLCTDAHMVEG